MIDPRVLKFVTSTQKDVNEFGEIMKMVMDKVKAKR